jgi:hypothetical protein
VALRYRSVRGDGRLCGPLFPSHAASGGSTSDLRSGFLGLPHGGGEHDEEAGLRAEGGGGAGVAGGDGGGRRSTAASPDNPAGRGQIKDGVGAEFVTRAAGQSALIREAPVAGPGRTAARAEHHRSQEHKPFVGQNARLKARNRSPVRVSRNVHGQGGSFPFAPASRIVCREGTTYPARLFRPWPSWSPPDLGRGAGGQRTSCEVGHRRGPLQSCLSRGTSRPASCLPPPGSSHTLPCRQDSLPVLLLSLSPSSPKEHRYRFTPRHQLSA